MTKARRVRLPAAVPVEELGLTDYYDVVARPIDLGTIRQRLSKHRHKDVPAALADVERVWANCRLYNNEDDEIVEMCAAVEEEWNARWAEQLDDVVPAPDSAWSVRC